MMKSLVWVVLLAGVVTTFNSCDKEPDPIPPITGTWGRTEYEFVELPTGFSYSEGATLSSLGETGYTFVFKADGTYSRSVTPGFSDKGTWVIHGTKLTVSPDDPDDISIIENSGFIGLEFDIEEELTDQSVRLLLSARINSGDVGLGFPSDAAIDESEATGEDIPDEAFQAIDVTMIYKFNKIQ